MASSPIDLSRRRRERALTAAAMRLEDLGEGDKELERQLQRHEKWQSQAWGYYDEIGEVHYGINVASDMLSKGKVVAVATPEADSEPVPVDDPDSGIPADVARLAIEILDGFRAPIGGQAQLLRSIDANRRVAGEMFVLFYEGPNPALMGWHVRSTEEVEVKDDKVVVKGLGSFPRSAVARAWQPHPRRFEAADSGLRGVLSQCEGVILADRQFRGSLRSRLFAGLLLLANDFREGTPDPTTDNAGDGEAQDDPNVMDLITALTTAIQHEGSASAVVPNILYGPLEAVKDGVHRIDFAKQIDPDLLLYRTDCIRRIAQGLDMPPESVLGVGDATHWNSLFIGEDAVRHVEAGACFAGDVISAVVLRPGLAAAGVDPATIGRIAAYVDLDALRKRPKADEDAKYAYEKGEISGPALRRVLQIAESDAPDEDETKRWLATQKGNVDPTITAGLLSDVLGEPVSGGDGQGAADEAAPEEGTGDEGGTGDFPPGPVAAAAAEGVTSERLARIELTVSERLFAATLGALRRAMEKAGHRARAKVAAAHRKTLDGHDPSTYVHLIGPALLAAAGVSDDEMLEDALDSLADDFGRWVTEAQRDALGAYLLMAASMPSPAALDALALRNVAAREAAWDWFSSTGLALLGAKLAAGEDVTEWEVRSLVRQALALAGGADEIGSPGALADVPEGAATGITTGPSMLAFATVIGLTVVGWRWEHDSPDHPFPEHVELAGEERQHLDDFGDHPGSHKGCLCSTEPVFLIDTLGG